MQESPLVGQQYIFFLGAPTDDMPADAYEQLGWKFCQMLVGDDDTLYYLPYPAEDALSPADTANDIAHITLNDLRELIHRYTSWNFTREPKAQTGCMMDFTPRKTNLFPLREE